MKSHSLRHFTKKNTFSGIYLNFKSFVPEVYKKGLIFCLVFRIYSICSDWARIHDEINKLKCLLLWNTYPLKFINFCIKKCLDKYLTKKVKLVVTTVPKKGTCDMLTILG